MGAVATLVAELRGHGITVHEWPGWDGRGNEGIGQISPVGAILHHTATGYGNAFQALVTGRPDLRGTLCNFAGNSDGTLTVVASGLTWHAGAGAGPSLGPLAPWRTALNRWTLGLEIVYPGDEPMTERQYITALMFARIATNLFGGGDIERARAHGETNGNAPGGDSKWDPGYAPGRMINMTDFRAQARFILEDDVEVTDIIGKRPDGSNVSLGEALINLYNGAYFGGGDAGEEPVFMAVNKALAFVRDNNQALAQAYIADGGEKNPNARGIGKIVWESGSDIDKLTDALAALQLRVKAEEDRNATFRKQVLDRLDTVPGGTADVEAIARRVDELLAARLAQ